MIHPSYTNIKKFTFYFVGQVIKMEVSSARFKTSSGKRVEEERACGMLGHKWENRLRIILKKMIFLINRMNSAQDRNHLRVLLNVALNLLSLLIYNLSRYIFKIYRQEEYLFQSLVKKGRKEQHLSGPCLQTAAIF